jgi:hypothetical protein
MSCEPCQQTAPDRVVAKDNTVRLAKDAPFEFSDLAPTTRWPADGNAVARLADT